MDADRPMDPELVERTRAHYREKFAAHGATPQGVDWNGEESQTSHFAELARLLPADGRAFTVNDWGSGYGALAVVGALACLALLVLGAWAMTRK